MASPCQIVHYSKNTTSPPSVVISAHCIKPVVLYYYGTVVYIHNLVSDKPMSKCFCYYIQNYICKNTFFHTTNSSQNYQSP